MKKMIILLLAIALISFSAGCTGSQQNHDGISVATRDEIAAEAQKPTEMTAQILRFEIIPQLPELPTGCEITSLAMALRYNGIPADKCDLADNYLKKGEIDETDYREAFIGDPRDEDAYGCYAPVIVNAANRYLSENGYSLRAVDLSDTAFADLLRYIDREIPVIFWATQDMREGRVTETWEINGEELDWIFPEHCMVLIGYSDDSIRVADPLTGKVKTYDRKRTETAYDMLTRQAIILQ